MATVEPDFDAFCEWLLDYGASAIEVVSLYNLALVWLEVTAPTLNATGLEAALERFVMNVEDKLP